MGRVDVLGACRRALLLICFFGFYCSSICAKNVLDIELFRHGVPADLQEDYRKVLERDKIRIVGEGDHSSIATLLEGMQAQTERLYSTGDIGGGKIYLAVVDDMTPNAFCLTFEHLPDTKFVGIHLGAIRGVTSDVQLLGLLAHELSHPEAITKEVLASERKILQKIRNKKNKKKAQVRHWQWQIVNEGETQSLAARLLIKLGEPPSALNDLMENFDAPVPYFLDAEEYKLGLIFGDHPTLGASKKVVDATASGAERGKGEEVVDLSAAHSSQKIISGTKQWLVSDEFRERQRAQIDAILSNIQVPPSVLAGNDPATALAEKHNEYWNQLIPLFYETFDPPSVSDFLLRLISGVLREIEPRLRSWAEGGESGDDAELPAAAHHILINYRFQCFDLSKYALREIGSAKVLNQQIAVETDPEKLAMWKSDLEHANSWIPKAEKFFSFYRMLFRTHEDGTNYADVWRQVVLLEHEIKKLKKLKFPVGKLALELRRATEKLKTLKHLGEYRNVGPALQALEADLLKARLEIDAKNLADVRGKRFPDALITELEKFGKIVPFSAEHAERLVSAFRSYMEFRLCSARQANQQEKVMTEEGYGFPRFFDLSWGSLEGQASGRMADVIRLCHEHDAALAARLFQDILKTVLPLVVHPKLYPKIIEHIQDLRNGKRVAVTWVGLWLDETFAREVFTGPFLDWYLDLLFRNTLRVLRTEGLNQNDRVMQYLCVQLVHLDRIGAMSSAHRAKIAEFFGDATVVIRSWLEKSSGTSWTESEVQNYLLLRCPRLAFVLSEKPGQRLGEAQNEFFHLPQSKTRFLHGKMDLYQHYELWGFQLTRREFFEWAGRHSHFIHLGRSFVRDADGDGYKKRVRLAKGLLERAHETKSLSSQTLIRFFEEFALSHWTFSAMTSGLSGREFGDHEKDRESRSSDFVRGIWEAMSRESTATSQRERRKDGFSRILKYLWKNPSLLHAYSFPTRSSSDAVEFNLHLNKWLEQVSPKERVKAFADWMECLDQFQEDQDSQRETTKWFLPDGRFLELLQKKEVLNSSSPEDLLRLFKALCRVHKRADQGIDQIFDAFWNSSEKAPHLREAISSPLYVHHLLDSYFQKQLADWQIERECGIRTVAESLKSDLSTTLPIQGIRPLFRRAVSLVAQQFPSPSAASTEIVLDLESKLLANREEVNYSKKFRLHEENWTSAQKIRYASVADKLAPNFSGYEKLKVIRNLLGEESPDTGSAWAKLDSEWYRQMYSRLDLPSRVLLMQAFFDPDSGILVSQELEDGVIKLILGSFGEDLIIREAFSKYIRAAKDHQKISLYSYLLASRNKDQSRGAILRRTLAGMPPFGDIAAQYLRSSGLLESDMQPDFEGVFDAVSFISRERVLDDCDAFFDGQGRYTLIPRHTAGVGSLNYTVVADIVDNRTGQSQTALFKILKTEASGQLVQENGVWERWVADLRTSQNQSILRLGEVIEEVREYVMDSASVDGGSLNHERERTAAYEMDAVYEKLGRPHGAHVVLPLDFQNLIRPEFQKSVTVYPYVSHERFVNLSAGDKGEIALTAIHCDLGAATKLGAFCPDAHPGNVLRPKDRSIGPRRIDPAQFRVHPMEEIDATRKALVLLMRNGKWSRKSARALAEILPQLLTGLSTSQIPDEELLEIVRAPEMPSEDTPHFRLFHIRQRLEERQIARGISGQVRLKRSCRAFLALISRLMMHRGESLHLTRFNLELMEQLGFSRLERELYRSREFISSCTAALRSH